jgi:5'(3')-deoxyribonucleotidase
VTSAITACVVLDVDGPLADFHSACMQIVDELTGRRNDSSKITGWNIFDVLLADLPDADRRHVKAETYRRMKEPGWCSSIPVHVGARTNVEMLRELGRVKFATSPMDGPTWMRERALWLKKHFGAHPEHDVHHSGDKTDIAGHVLVDDKTQTCVDWQAWHPDGRAIRWDVGFAVSTESFDGVTTNLWSVVAEQTRQAVEDHRRRGVMRWQMP